VHPPCKKILATPMCWLFLPCNCRISALCIFNAMIALQLVYAWHHHDCPLSSSQDFCRCLTFLDYDNYHAIYPVAVIVYTGIAVLYSITCRQIYFCRDIHRNSCQFRQVFLTSIPTFLNHLSLILYAPRNVRDRHLLK